MALSAAGVPYTPRSLNNYMVTINGDFDENHDVSFGTTIDDIASSGKGIHYEEFNSTSVQDLEDKLCGSGFPVIVGVDLQKSKDSRLLIPGHFVLVTGKQGNQFQIVDPGNPLLTTLDAYHNIFQTRGYVSARATQGQSQLKILGDPVSDLSSIHISANDSELLITDPFGNRTGFDRRTQQDLQEIPESVYTRDALENDETGAPPTQTSHFINIRTPAKGTYTITLVPTQSLGYQLFVASFSQDGTPQPRTSLSGMTTDGLTASYQLTFDSVPGSVPELTPILQDPFFFLWFFN